ncbi:hypothetical protein [Pseudoduganella sp. UC29_71]|uniref:hypothetical protein n=1 Tax=Pseudoduganella sp. UC29_71 TaxID=3350174 RepID=UPI00366FBA5A
MALFLLKAPKGGLPAEAVIKPMRHGGIGTAAESWQFECTGHNDARVNIDAQRGATIFVTAAELPAFVRLAVEPDRHSSDLDRELASALGAPPDSPPVLAKPSASSDVADFYLGADTCPSCRCTHESMKRLMWARKMAKDELKMAINKAYAATCAEFELDGALVRADCTDEDSPQLMSAAFGRAKQDAAPRFDTLLKELSALLGQEAARAAWEVLGTQKIDAHNVIGQNAIKTGTSHANQGGGSHAVIEKFYARHVCLSAVDCMWKKQAGHVEDLIGVGGVMSSIYCQTGPGGQCKICEAEQGEWHLLQRGLFFLDEKDVPLEFVGLQWCGLFLAGLDDEELGALRLEPACHGAIRQQIQRRREQFVAFLEKWTCWQIAKNLGGLKALCEERARKATDGKLGAASVEGSVGTVIKVVQSTCPDIFSFLLEHWEEFGKEYQSGFLEVCRLPVGPSVSAAALIKAFEHLQDNIADAERLWKQVGERTDDAAQRGYDAEVEVAAYLHAVIRTHLKFCFSRGDAEAAILRGAVNVAGAVVKDKTARVPGEAGDIVAISYTAKGKTTTKHVRLRE